MAEKRIPDPKFTTDRGVTVYPRLDKPDYGSDQFPAPRGVFKTKLRVSAAAKSTQTLIAKLRPLHDVAVQQGEELFKALKPETRKKLKAITVNDIFTEVLDKVTEEPTGDLEFSFKCYYKTEIKNGKNAGKTWFRYPALFDARGNAMNSYDENGKVLLQCPPIWGGSIGKFTFETRPYFIGGTGSCGLSMTLLAGQIIKRVVGSDKTAGDFGFGAEEGYAYEPEGDDVPAATEDTSAPGEDTGDF